MTLHFLIRRHHSWSQTNVPSGDAGCYLREISQLMHFAWERFGSWIGRPKVRSVQAIPELLEPPRLREYQDCAGRESERLYGVGGWGITQASCIDNTWYAWIITHTLTHPHSAESRTFQSKLPAASANILQIDPDMYHIQLWQISFLEHWRGVTCNLEAHNGARPAALWIVSPPLVDGWASPY